MTFRTPASARTGSCTATSWLGGWPVTLTSRYRSPRPVRSPPVAGQPSARGCVDPKHRSETDGLMSDLPPLMIIRNLATARAPRPAVHDPEGFSRGVMEILHDHGSTAGGGWRGRPENSAAIFPPWRPSLWGELGKSESPARSDRYVVVGPSTTKECRGWPNHDKRAPGTHVPAGASGPGVTPAPVLGREVPDDHGSAGGGAWQSNPGPADPGNRLVIEWNAGLS